MQGLASHHATQMSQCHQQGRLQQGLKHPPRVDVAADNTDTCNPRVHLQNVDADLAACSSPSVSSL